MSEVHDRMTWQALVTIAATTGAFTLLAFGSFGVDSVMMACLALLLVTGIVTPEQGLYGFSNEGVVTVAVLFVVAMGIRETGAVAVLVDRFLKRPRSIAGAQMRMMLPAAAISGFMNNTPLVAIMIPAVTDWARRLRLPASKLMIPLSYATVLGGMCTVIGTSTNLLVDGMVRAGGLPFDGLEFFEVGKVGLPCALVGIAFIIVAGKWLLPDRSPALNLEDNPREYVLQMIVEPGCALVGKSIESAGLRHLPGVFLMEIDRGGDIMAAVSPETILRDNDRLVFVGVVESVLDLQKIRGLKPATGQVFKLRAASPNRILVEAVVSDSSPLAGMSIRDGRFRQVYDAVVIAVARNGERIRMKVGDIVLRAGDTLLLEAHAHFLQRMRNSRHFYLVSRVEGFTPARHEKAGIALAIMVGMVVAATFLNVDMVLAAIVAAGLMIMTRCCTTDMAIQSLDLRLLIAIAAALGIGKALQTTGAAAAIADIFIGLAGPRPMLALALVYGITLLFTETITNNAAAAIAFPIAVSTAQHLGVGPKPFVIAVMIAASAGFATPLGYQTHLMVYGPGGYRFSDFMKIGLPMDLLVWATAMACIPFFFPL